MENCLVSVIIPVYNCEKYLQQCVESLLKQTYQIHEIILIDDGSLDRSPEICDSFAENSTIIKVIHKANAGSAAARKKGIQQSTGDYILFIDADDWVAENYVEQLVSLARIWKTDIVIGTFLRYTGDHYLLYDHFFPQGYYDKIQCRSVIFPSMLSTSSFYSFGVSPSMCGKLFKIEIVKKNIGALEAGVILGEDGCFTYSALLDCSSIYISNECGYIYRRNATSVTHRFDERLLQDGKKLKAFLEKLAATKEWDVNTQIDEYMAYVCNYTVTQALKSGYGTSKENRKRLKTYIRDVFPVGFLKNRNFLKSKKTTLIRYMLIRCRALTLLSKILLR